jgi:hypothetical protein
LEFCYWVSILKDKGKRKKDKGKRIKVKGKRKRKKEKERPRKGQEKTILCLTRKKGIRFWKRK